MSKAADIADALDHLAAELDEQREAKEQRHKELMEAITGMRQVVAHWVDEYNLNRAHVEEQFDREGKAIRKLQQEVAALQLAEPEPVNGGE